MDATGHDIPSLLKSILELVGCSANQFRNRFQGTKICFLQFPLDVYVGAPVALMDLVQVDKERSLVVPVWATYQVSQDMIYQQNVQYMMSYWTCSLHHQDICNKAADAQVAMEKVERFAFYRRAKVRSVAQIEISGLASSSCSCCRNRSPLSPPERWHSTGTSY